MKSYLPTSLLHRDRNGFLYVTLWQRVLPNMYRVSNASTSNGKDAAVCSQSNACSAQPSHVLLSALWTAVYAVGRAAIDFS